MFLGRSLEDKIIWDKLENVLNQQPAVAKRNTNVKLFRKPDEIWHQDGII